VSARGAVRAEASARAGALAPEGVSACVDGRVRGEESASAGGSVLAGGAAREVELVRAALSARVWVLILEEVATRGALAFGGAARRDAALGRGRGMDRASGAAAALEEVSRLGTSRGFGGASCFGGACFGIACFAVASCFGAACCAGVAACFDAGRFRGAASCFTPLPPAAAAEVLPRAFSSRVTCSGGA
jgi:hypothetical protein